MSKEQPKMSEQATAEPVVVPTDIEKNPKSPLLKAAEQLGTGSMREVQAAQAQSRAKIDDTVELTPERVKELDGMTVEDLANEIRSAEAKKTEIMGKMAKAQAKVDELTLYVDGLRRKYEIANARTPSEKAAEYMESQKQERIQRFKEALHVRGQMEEAGIGHYADLQAIGLGVSPIDMAISADIMSRRRLRSMEARKAK